MKYSGSSFERLHAQHKVSVSHSKKLKNNVSSLLQNAPCIKKKKIEFSRNLESLI